MTSTETPKIDSGALLGTDGGIANMGLPAVLAGLSGRMPQAAGVPVGDKDLVAQIVSAYVSHHNLSPNQLIELMRDVRDFIASSHWPRPDAGRRDPFVPVAESVHPDYLVCLEDGARYKSLKRYLARRYNMSPEDYRRKWGLPDSYPMVAPNFSQSRSVAAKAKRMGGRRFTRIEPQGAGA